MRRVIEMTCKNCVWFVSNHPKRDSFCSSPYCNDATPDERWGKKKLKDWFDYQHYNSAKPDDDICTSYTTGHWEYD